MLLYVIPIVLFLVLFLTRPTTSIPGPRSLPIVGYVPQYLIRLYKGDFLEMYVSHFARFGSTFQHSRLFNSLVVHISDLADLKYFFTSGNFDKGPEIRDVLHDIFGDGIFNAGGENWRVQRQTASSLFHSANLSSFVPLFAERADVMASTLLKSTVSGGSLDIQQLFLKYTLDAIGQLGFGTPLNALQDDKEALQFAASFDYIQEQTAVRGIIHPFWKILPKTTFLRHLKVVDSFIEKMVESRRKEIAGGVDLSDRVDLLSKFISVKNADGSSFDDKYLLDVLKNFLIAGRDTTAVCLSWAIYLLSTHPQVEDRVVDEIARVVGDGPVTYEKLKSLKYTKQVIDETLRLYPPVPLNPLVSIEDAVLPSGIVVPKGTKVMYPGYAIHRLPQYWNDPDSFNPDRWETDTIKPFQFVAFHGGPRICLGQNMAYEEIKVALCAILPRFRLRVADPSSVHYHLSITLPIKNGLPVYVSLREK